MKLDFFNFIVIVIICGVGMKAYGQIYSFASKVVVELHRIECMLPPNNMQNPPDGVRCEDRHYNPY